MPAHVRRFRRSLAALALALHSLPALALPAGAPTSGNLLQVILGMFAVLAVILGGAWMLKRHVQPPGAGNAALRVLGGVSLGPRERAVLLQIGDRQLLVGVAPGRVQTLHILERPVGAVAPERALPAPAGFAAQLAALLRPGGPQ